MDWTNVPHVVVVPNALPGHAIPFLQFARHLAAEGIVTTVVASDRHVLELESLVGSADLTAQGVPLRLIGLRDKKTHLSYDDWKQEVRCVREAELNVIRLLQEAVTDVASPESQQLRGVQPTAPPVCILHDMFTEWAQEAAEKLHIEKHLLYVSPAMSLLCDLESSRLYRDGRFPITRETRDMIISDIPGLPPTRVLDLPRTLINASIQMSVRSTYMRFRQADVILLNTFYDLEKRALDALRNEVLGGPDMQASKFILDIGPLLPESYVNEDRADKILQQESEERDPCLLWLNTQPPNSVLYVSFGSSATLPAPQLLELAQGLEASDCSFLWIVRPPNAPSISADAANPESVTEFFPSGFEEHVKGRGMCYSGWVPQMRILKHPAVGGFLSHCGWNSALETVCAGVPVLGWPIGAEQHLIRRFLVNTLRVAIELNGNAYTKEDLESDVVRPPVFVSKEEIEKKARSLMRESEGQLVRENIQKLRAKSCEAGAPGGSSRSNFDTYVRFLHRNGGIRLLA